MPTHTYFKVCECPDLERCSDASWSKAKVWGYSEEEVRNQLHDHLSKSSLHNVDLDEDEINEMVTKAVVIEETWSQPESAA